MDILCDAYYVPRATASMYNYLKNFDILCNISTNEWLKYVSIHKTFIKFNGSLNYRLPVHYTRGPITVHWTFKHKFIKKLYFSNGSVIKMFYQIHGVLLKGCLLSKVEKWLFAIVIIRK